MSPADATVGVLALQGDFAEHVAALRRTGFAARPLRSAADLEGLDAIVLPGGESTTMLKLLRVEGMYEPLGRTLRSGIPVLATCAGLILLAQKVENPEQRSYGLLPITVVRNGYGRQYHSGTFALEVDGEFRDQLPGDVTGTFIRAPRVTAVGDGCEVLARRDGDPVLLRAGNVIAACFHPELQEDHPVSRLFAEAVQRHCGARRASAGQPLAG